MDMVQDDSNKPVGMPPATLVYTGHKTDVDTAISIMEYGDGKMVQHEFSELETLLNTTTDKLWINTEGFTNIEEIIKLCRSLNINEMVIEDILNTPAPTKLEDHGDFVLVSIKLPVCELDDGSFDIQTFFILVFDKIILTFSEEKLRFLNPIYRRMQVKGKRIQSNGVDYLAWAILDIISDQLRFFMRTVEDKIDNLESLIVLNLREADVFHIYQLRREIARLHRSFRPTFNYAHQFIQIENELIRDSSYVFFKDLRDNFAEIQELADHLLDQSTAMRELYFTMNGHKMNQAMKVLAAISVIFLPLSFLAGVFGMNFKNMPELDLEWGYPVAWMLFIIIGVSLYFLFKRKGWFNS